MNSKMTNIIRNFPKSVHIMVITEGILSLAMGAFSFLQILYYDYVKLLPRQIGMIYSIGSLFGLLAFFMTPLIKKYGRKNIMCCGLLLFSIGIAFHIFFRGYLMLLIAQIIISIGNAMIQITDLQLLYDYAGGIHECCAYSYKYSVGLIAGAIGSLIAGNITRIPYAYALEYRNLFFLSAVTLALGTLWRYISLPKSVNIIRLKKESSGDIGEVINVIKKSSKIRNFSLLLFIASLSFNAVGPYNNLILKINFNYGNDIISVITFIITILGMAAVILMPSAIDLIGVEKFNVISFVFVMAACFTLTFISSPSYFAVVLIVRCIFALLLCSLLDCLMMSNIEERERDIFASIKILAYGISAAVGNFIGGELLNYFGYRFNYLFGGVVISISLWYFMRKVKSFMVVKKQEKECKCSIKKRGLSCKGGRNY